MNHHSHSSPNCHNDLDTANNYQQPNNNLNLSDLEEIRSVQIENEIFEIPRRYRLIELRGQGSYGIVCSARDTKSANAKQLVAIKKNRNVFPRTIAPQLPSSNSNNKEMADGNASKGTINGKVTQQQYAKKLPHRSKLSQKRILRELKILTHLRGHPNIIQLHDVIEPRSYEAFGDVYFVTDLMEADLRDILESNQTLTDQHIQYFMYQLLLAVHYSQSASILHRDLKPENILLNSNCELKICDFGLARGIDFECDPRMSTNYVQTRWYRAPELLLNNPTISPQTDMWSIGCILGELLGRKVLFKGNCPVDQMKKIINILGTPEDPNDIKGSEEGIKFVLELPYCRPKDFHTMFPNANSLAIDLLKQMLVFNHEKRITTDQALKHPYFKDLYDERDILVCDKKFDFSFEDHLDDDSDALKRCAYETIMNFRRMIRQEEMARIAQPLSSMQPSAIPSHSTLSAQDYSTSKQQPEKDVMKKKSEYEEQKLRKKMEEEERKKEEKKKKKEEKRKKESIRSRFDFFRRARNVFNL
jgi:serine/threonine protein kinase